MQNKSNVLVFGRKYVILQKRNLMTREQFIEKHNPLFWYTPVASKKDISDSLLVETILNYGTMDDVRELFTVMGIEKVASVFFAAKERQIGNYYPEIYNYFTLLFNRYVSQRDIE